MRIGDLSNQDFDNIYKQALHRNSLFDPTLGSERDLGVKPYKP